MEQFIVENIDVFIELGLLVAGLALGGKGVAIFASNSRRAALHSAIRTGVLFAIKNRRNLDSVDEIIAYVKTGAPDAIRKWALDTKNREHLVKMILGTIEDVKREEAVAKAGREIAARHAENMRA